MLKLRTTATAVAFVIAAAAAPAAHATLIIEAGGTVDAGGVITGGTVEGTDATNTFVGPGNFSMAGFNINSLTLEGVNAFGGNGTLMDVGALDTSSSGAGSLNLFFIETGLTGKSPVLLSADLSASLLKNISVTRSIYFDPTDTGTESELLLSTSGTSANISDIPFEFDGTYALIEEITLTANGGGATLSADDQVTIPEPLSLGLFGGGLFGLGLIRRRRRS